jgi:periplasmic divalent cation tolerance protein
MTEKIVVFTNCGSEEEALRVARALVESRLAACVNILPGVRSVYPWKGAVQEDNEWMLVIKSTRPLFDQLSAALRKAHSYEIPEVLALAVVDGSQEYLDWMDREMGRNDTLNSDVP